MRQAHPIAVGQQFGGLIVRQIYAASVNGRNRRYIDCACVCGRTQTRVQPYRLYRGETKSCGECSKPKPRLEKSQVEMRRAFRRYRVGAEQRKYGWEINRETFALLYFKPCTYCGLSPSKGVDRKNNAAGYTLENCAPCCKDCNMAKRDKTEIEFRRWLLRAALFQGFSL